MLGLGSDFRVMVRVGFRVTILHRRKSVLGKAEARPFLFAPSNSSDAGRFIWPQVKHFSS